MKKSMILLGLLGIGYANAQMYDEKVGINTETPSATLNVKTKNNTSSPKNLELENQGGTKLMTVLNLGNVGIGTDNPKEKLHINNGKLLSEGANSGVVIKRNGDVGPYIQLENTDKVIPRGTEAGAEPVSRWRIFNMKGEYGNTLRFWAYGTDESGAEVNLGSKVVIGDKGNFGVGLFSKVQPSEKLHIESGNVRINKLPTNTGGESDKVVVVDNSGVLKSVDRSTIAPSNGIQNTARMVCDASNAGKVNYTTIQKDGKTLGIFGFCMQRDTQYVWAYMAGGSNIFGTSANGAAFGDGL